MLSRILLIFCCSQYLVLSRIIELPFYKQKIKDNLSEEDVIKYFIKNPITIETKIGTPEQSLLFVPKMENVYSYVLEDLENSTKPEDYSEYKSNKSYTYQFIRKCGLYEWLYGKAAIIKENINVGNLGTEKLTLIHTLNYENIKSFCEFPGIIGFGILSRYEQSLYESNFIYNLKQKDIINSYSFFVQFDSDDRGKIIIGSDPNGYDSVKYPNKINTFSKLPGSDKVYYGILIDKLTYNEQIFESIILTAARIKLEYGLIGVGNEIREVLDRDLFSDLLNKRICHVVTVISNSFYVCERGKVDKSRLHELKIFNKDFGMNFTVDFKDLFYDYGDKTFFLVEFGLNWVVTLGDIFMKKYMFTYNQDNKDIAMYIKQTEKPEEKGMSPLVKFFIVLIIFIIFLIIAGILYYIYKGKIKIFKRFKREGIELSEDDDYLKPVL